MPAYKITRRTINPDAELVYVPDGKYKASPKRMAWLLKQVSDGDEFRHAYETMSLKELRELYELKTDDVYILMHHYHVPYLYPNATGNKGFHTRSKHDQTRRDLEVDYDSLEPLVKAEAKAAVANQQNVNINMPEIDYDKLAQKIVYHMARNMLKGYLND